MELLQLNYFRTVARLGKISSAAQELYLSPPALSTSIARLERELGCALFDRTGNRITLNAQGEIFLRHVNEVFSCLDRAQSELAQSLLRQQNNIWVATTGSNPWMSLITAFSQENPTLALTCTTLSSGKVSNSFSQYPLLLAEDDDISPELSDQLESLFLFRDQPAIMVHPDHPLARKEQVTAEDLRRENLILPIPGMHRRDRLVELLRCSGVDTDAATSCSYVINRNMVQENMGVAFTTVRSHHVNLGPLRIVPLVNPLAPWNMRLFWRRDHTMTPAEESFRTFALQFYGADHHNPAVTLE